MLKFEQEAHRVLRGRRVFLFSLLVREQPATIVTDYFARHEGPSHFDATAASGQVADNFQTVPVVFVDVLDDPVNLQQQRNTNDN